MALINEEKLIKKYPWLENRLSDTKNMEEMVKYDEENLANEIKRHKAEIEKINERIGKHRKEVKKSTFDRFSIFNVQDLSNTILKLINNNDNMYNYEINKINNSVVMADDECLSYVKGENLDMASFAYTIGKSESDISNIPLNNIYIQYTNMSNSSIKLEQNCLKAVSNNECFQYVDKFINFLIEYRICQNVEELSTDEMDRLLNEFIKRTKDKKVIIFSD